MATGVIMMKAVSVILLLVIIQGLALQETTYCVKPDNSEVAKTFCNCHNYTNWSTVTSNSSKYFTSYTKFCFSLGIFNLSIKLFINNVTNISIISSNSSKPTSIKCYNNSFLSISNATFVTIQNFELETCGANVQQYIIVQYTYTALLLHNVGSVNILNVTFKNSVGHSIIGINLMESSILQEISVLYMNDSSIVSKVIMGGIVLLYSDEMTNYIINYDKHQRVIIEHCKIYYMHNKLVTAQTPNDVLGSVAFVLEFNQQNYSVIVKMVNTSIINVTAQNNSLILISYNSLNTSKVAILNSNFSRNNIFNSSLIKIIQGRGECRFCKPITIFESKNCILSHNNAQSIYHITQSSHSLHQNVTVFINITSSVFTHNNASGTFWRIEFEKEKEYTPIINVLIKQCSFAFNNDLNIEFHMAGNVTLAGTLFANNALNKKQPKAMLRCSKSTILIFKEYNEFSFNTAYRILDLSNYIILSGKTYINISKNNAEVIEHKSAALIYFSDNSNDYNHLCMFQFYSSLPKISKELSHKTPTDSFTIFFKDNFNYSSLIYGTQLNSCFWLKGTNNFGNLTPGDVMANVLRFNKTREQVLQREVSTLCYCDNRISADCIKDHFKPIFPGQTIPINLKQTLPYNRTSIYSISQQLEQLQEIKQCSGEPYQLQQNLFQTIDNSCTPIPYKVYSTPDQTQCYVSFQTAYPGDTLYIYYIDIHKNCPLGFSLSDGSCECDSKLKTVFPTIRCDVNTQTINHLGKGWIGLSAENKILCVKFCAPSLCKLQPTNIQLNSSDTQCNYNRGGIACGQCPSGLSAVLGSLSCKRCSNEWLFLIPVFLLAGLLLIFLLFAINLTIVDGKINGFILYLDVIIVNIHGLISPSSNMGKVISLMNLSLGIETCFYHGMNEYDKIWLQFAFISYLLFIVAILAFASRYSSTVEKLTRRRVIPVIATIFLLTYSKLLLITAKVLYSYTTLHCLSDNTKTIVWMWDTNMPLFGIKFSILFIASLLLVLVILVPLNIFLLFTKFPLQIRFLAKYLKPYLDVFQAPFKDKCRYFPGLELVIRWTSFAIGSIFLTTAHERLALDNFICVFLLVYLCTFKPFKSLTNTLLYITYVINVQCMIILQIYSNLDIRKTYYRVIFHILIFIAFAEFAATVLYYLYINQLQKIKQIKLFVTRINNNWLKYCNRFKAKHVPSQPPTIKPLGDYEQLQDELLLADPSQ